MDADYWLARWRDGKTGWHEREGSAPLRQNLARLVLGPGKRVLVPLSGKSHDLAILAQTGATVVGVELSETAAEAFFAEHGLTPERSVRAGGTFLSAAGVTIVVGDFFAQTPDTLGGTFDVVFDRAARIALPPALRPTFAATLERLAPAGLFLVVTFEHDVASNEPPFSVSPAEVAAAHPTRTLEHLGEDDRLEPGGSLAQRGATFVRENALLLRR